MGWNIGTKRGKKRQARRERRREKRQARRDAKKPRQQYYGGSKEEGAKIRERNQAGIESGSARETEGLDRLDNERMLASNDLRSLSAQAMGERANAAAQLGAVDQRVQDERDQGAAQYREIDQRVQDERAEAAARYNQVDRSVQRERLAGAAQYNQIDRNVQAERERAGSQYDALAASALGMQQKADAQDSQYGSGADAALADYAGGRSAILGGATELEQLGRSAAGRYTSAADAAFNASTERAQRQALSLAAGRGNDSIRTALATASAANQQAMLDQQVVRAQEMNQLLGLESDAIAGAADIRSGLSAQDQQAAQIQASRQEAARMAAQNALGLRGEVTTANANLGMTATGQRADLATANSNLGMTATGQRADIATANTTAGQVANAQRGDLVTANSNLGLAATDQRANIANTNAQIGLATGEQRGNLATTDATLGMSAAGARADAGAGERAAFLGAEGMQEGSQLGASVAGEAARLANAQTKGFTGFLGKITGGLNNIKATADAGDLGPAGKLMGKTTPV